MVKYVQNNERKGFMSSKWPNRYYCKKCGATLLLIIEREKVCKYCGSKVYPFPDECDKFSRDEYDKLKEYLRENYVKTSPEYNPRSAQFREKIQARGRIKQEAMDAAKAAGKTSSPSGPPKVECPYCHSTSTKKISTLSKAAHTYMFGIFSMSRNSKNFHCNKCGADF